MSTVKRFIRFADPDGQVYYGSPEADPSINLIGTSAGILSGDPYTGLTFTGNTAVIDKVLCPLESTPMIICIGLNYEFHTKETSLPVPKYPAVITKPADALAGPYDDISIPPIAQSNLDYEGEVCFIINKDCKNIPASLAHVYILGYTAGNDLSARNFQVPGGDVGGQFCYAKSFDGFAPIGPAVVLQDGDDLGGLEVEGEGEREGEGADLGLGLGLGLVTSVNGVERQAIRTHDMIFGVRELVEFLSRGRTLRRGTVIMTGTPMGVGMFMDPSVYLGDGDVVEVEVEGVGAIRNRMVFE